MTCTSSMISFKSSFPEKNILAYDGTDSSVYAIKQFSYLFPEFTGNKTVLVFAKDNDQNTFPDEQNIEELVSRHFSDLTLFKLGIDPKKYFALWMSEGKDSILVSG